MERYYNSKKTSKKRIEMSKSVLLVSFFDVLIQRKPQKRGLKYELIKKYEGIFETNSKKTSKKRIEITIASMIMTRSGRIQRKPQKRGLK